MPGLASQGSAPVFKPLFSEYRVGFYLQPENMVGHPNLTFTGENDMLWATAFPVSRKARFDRIGIWIGTHPGPFGHIRLGLYNSLGNCFPKSPLALSNELTLAAVTNINDVINLTLNPGLYFFVWLSDDALAEFISTNTHVRVLGSDNLQLYPASWYVAPYPYGPLPDPFPPLGTTGLDHDPALWECGLRVAENL